MEWKGEERILGGRKREYEGEGAERGTVIQCVATTKRTPRLIYIGFYGGVRPGVD